MSTDDTESPFSPFGNGNAYEMKNNEIIVGQIPATLTNKLSRKPNLKNSLSHKFSSKQTRSPLTDFNSAPLMSYDQEQNVMESATSANSHEPSVNKTDTDLEVKRKSMQFYLAVVALILSTLALIAALIIAIVVIPNLGAVTTLEDGNSSQGAAIATGINKETNDSVNTIIIVNETNRYYQNNTIQYFDVNCSCPTNVYGIININKTYYPGGYYGWYYHSSYKQMYPFVDIHASIGDTIEFRAQFWTPEDVWLVSQEVYNECQSANETGWKFQLAISNEIRSDGDNYGGGYKLLLQNWHIRDWGEVLYFASNSGCENGIKLKVFIEIRESIPVILDDVSALDLSASDTVRDLETAIGHLSRVLVLSQFSDEQRIRSEGDSGLTNVRGFGDGERAYDDGSYSNGAVASIHDHGDHIHVVGIGEISAVLNGVEFETRHNDYNLNMASLTSSEYHAVEAVPLPDIPLSIVEIREMGGNIEDESNEMIEYFRAFKRQNESHRNYSLYFSAILCYLEGTWILSDDKLEEPFNSDRHHLDASTWKQLHDKIRWMMNSGRKEPSENLAHLPSSIRNLYNNTYPIISNWEYRILCSPLKNDISTKRFKISSDLSIQLLGSAETRKELYYSRRARFELNKWIDKNDPENNDGLNTDYWWNEGPKTWNYLDYLMEQIPGKDNYLANLTDKLPDNSAQITHFNDNKEYINSGYYSRYYALSNNDAMGSTKHRRGYSDRYLFAAKTSQNKVSPISFDYEMTSVTSSSTFINTQSRWSYAIPLEIIYLTPLTKWNPYNITYYSENEWVQLNEGRSGSCESGDEYIGWNEKNAYFTPIQIFDESKHETSGADTVKNGICVLDPQNQPRNVKASGHWITFPSIANNVGKVRQRYPIFPIHYGGNLQYKEIKALQDMILNKDTYDNIENGIPFWTDDRDLKYGFVINLIGGGHEHEIYIPGWKINYYWYDNIVKEYKNGSQYIITQDSYIANQHQHTVQIYRYKNVLDTWNYKILKCRYGTLTDNNQTYQNYTCGDHHNQLIRDTGDE